MVQRYLCAKNLSHARAALVASGVAVLVQFLLFLLIGIEAPPQPVVAISKPSLWHKLTCKMLPAHEHGEVNR